MVSQMARIEIDWIVCRGDERQVAEGRVHCPALKQRDTRQAVRVEDCLACRRLIATSVDRMRAGMCDTGESPQTRLADSNERW